jgi:hypothetical protein
MNTRIQTLFIIFIFSGILISCSKNSADPPQKVVGTIACQVVVKHHTWGVPGIAVHLKRNVQTFPGYDTSVYDLHRTTDTQGTVLFDSLYPGNYYLYSRGYDLIWGDTVTGYSLLSINDSSVSDNAITSILYVSE